MRTYQVSKAVLLNSVWRCAGTTAMLLAACLFVLPAQANAQPVAASVEEAILAEDWAKVADLLKSVDAKTDSPVLRLIKGHACLALNRNNQSLELFASALNDADREAWRQWADAFAGAHAKSAIAWYFKGDALARQKKWKSKEKDPEKAKQSPGADECFAEAIRLDTKCYLALNARGIVAHAVGSTLMARGYFVKATKAKEDFADAYASRGTLNVYRNSVKAEDDYVKARSHSTDKKPVLALMGLGCSYYGKQEYDAAGRSFDAVPGTSELAPLARRNTLAIELNRLAGALRSASEAGMSLTAVRQLALNAQSTPAANAPINSTSGTPEGRSSRATDGSKTRGVLMSAAGWKYWVWGGVFIWQLGNWGNLPDYPKKNKEGIVHVGEKEPKKPKAKPKPKPKPKPDPPKPDPPKPDPEPKGKGEGEGASSTTTKLAIGEELLPRLPGSVVTTVLGPGGGWPPIGPGPGWPPIGPGPGWPPVGPGPGWPPIGPGPGWPPIGPGPGWPPIGIPDFALVTEVLERITARIDQEITKRSTPAPRASLRKSRVPGGADSDSSKVRTNRGRWGVCNVYGLLYAVPLESSQKKSAKRTGPVK